MLVLLPRDRLLLLPVSIFALPIDGNSFPRSGLYLMSYQLTSHPAL